MTFALAIMIRERGEIKPSFPAPRLLTMAGATGLEPAALLRDGAAFHK